MKQRILLIAGCSHAAGSEINGLQDNVFNRQHSFGAYVARHYNMTPVNIAICGSTNAGIARSVINWFEKFYDPCKLDVFTLVSWTESTRLEIPAEKMYCYNFASKSADWYDETANRYMRVTFGWPGGTPEEKALVPDYHKFMAQNEAFLELMTFHIVLQLQYFFKANNVNYLMSNSMDVFTQERFQIKEMLESVNLSKYYKMLEPEESFYKKYRNLGYENKKAKYWHHDEVPHKLYSEELIKHIEENKCL